MGVNTNGIGNDRYSTILRELNRLKRLVANGDVGGGGVLERRHDFQSPYSYVAKASEGSGDNEAVWTITRITVSEDGTTTKGVVSNAIWNNRTSLTYL